MDKNNIYIHGCLLAYLVFRCCVISVIYLKVRCIEDGSNFAELLAHRDEVNLQELADMYSWKIYTVLI